MTAHDEIKQGETLPMRIFTFLTAASSSGLGVPGVI